MNPLLIGRAWHVPQELNLAAMRDAAELLRGRHDFRAFTSRREGTLADSTRTLTRCEFRNSGPLTTFTMEGDGFLYKMCRGIVGTLVRSGRGLMTCPEIAELLTHPGQRTRGVNSPAHGLILWRVAYSPRFRPDYREKFTRARSCRTRVSP